MRKKLKKKHSIGLFLLVGLINGCALTPFIGSPPDVRVCANLGERGYCRNTVTVNAVEMSGADWQKTLRGAVIVPAKSWAKMKAWQLNVCHQVQCDNDIGSWSKLISDLDSNLK